MPRKSPAITGAITGAAVGAAARFAVALGFLHYVSRWGGKWWDGAADMWWAALASGLIGAGVGGVAGWTCRPLLGALLGGVLSGGTCFGLFVVPTRLMIGMSHPGGSDRVETGEVIVGFAVMTLAGALAGFVGAAVGRRAARQAPAVP